MAEKVTRKKFIKRSAAAVGTASLVGYGMYKLLEVKSSDELYGEYPAESFKTRLAVNNPGAPKPNVILIYCDDLGYGDPGVFGSKSIRTPNIDSLARDGVMLTDYHSCNAICAPSRAGLLTGRYPFRTGVIGNTYPKKEPLGRIMARNFGVMLKGLGVLDIHEEYVGRGISDAEITLAEGLKTAGYKTCMIGKWHLGDYGQEPKYNPVRHGFDHYFGVPYSNDMLPFPLYRNEEKVEDIGAGEKQAKLTGLYTNEAVEFIDQSGDNPFFIYLAHTFPHQPLYASEKFKGKSKAGAFGDAVEEIDWSVGQLLKALRKRGIADDTLIMFTSDNGPWYEGSSGSLRGRKGQSFEGGFRVPFVARWPKAIPRGTVQDAMAINLDIYPTLLSLAGVELPKDRIVDGKNMLGLLTGKEKKSPHEAIYFYHYDRLEGVRNEDWKYFNKVNRYTWPIALDAASIPNGMGKAQMGKRWPLLYDMNLDRGESYNVIGTYPKTADYMKGLMKKWERSVSANPRGFVKKQG